MINDLKIGFKIMKYGHAAKLSIIASIIVGLFGLAFCALSLVMTSTFPGGYFLMMSVLLLLQLISTVGAANLVQTSPMKRKLQTSVPALISVVLMLGGYLFQAAASAVMVCVKPETLQASCTQLIFTAVIMGVIMLYYGAVYKYFVASTAAFLIVFLIIYEPMIMGDLLWTYLPFSGAWGNFVLSAAIGLVIILAGGVLEYLISLAVYKAPVSKWALGARLRKQM